MMAGSTDGTVVTERVAPCVRCGHPKTLLIQWHTEPRPASWAGTARLVWRARCVGSSQPHQCAGVHHSAAGVHGPVPVSAAVEGKRTERRLDWKCTDGRREYIAHRPRTWAEARQGQPVTSYRPAARFAVTGRGAVYVVRAS